MDCNGVRILVDLLTLAHLHTNRATVPLQVCAHHTHLLYIKLSLNWSDRKDFIKWAEETLSAHGMFGVSVSLCCFQSNVLEAAPDMKRESEKEWYFGNADKERRGPFSFEEVSVFSAQLQRVEEIRR